VPLDEDSFAYAFRSSRELTYRLKNDCKNANTHAHDDVHLVMLAHLRRRWSLSGREGFGFLSPSHRACEAGFSAFRKTKRLFSTAPGVKKRRRTAVTEVTERWTGRGLYLIGRVRSVLSVCACLGLLIGRGGTSGHAWRLTGNDRMLSLWRLVRLACASGH
jgi:hypothetical protein